MQCGGCRRIDPERQERIIRAVLANIANWEDRLEEISDHAIPVTGNRGRALSLMRDMKYAKLSLARLAGIVEDTPDQRGAEDADADPDQG